jgi:hypothetical protein
VNFRQLSRRAPMPWRTTSDTARVPHAHLAKSSRALQRLQEQRLHLSAKLRSQIGGTEAKEQSV